jgi:hypothetical protein
MSFKSKYNEENIREFCVYHAPTDGQRTRFEAVAASIEATARVGLASCPENPVREAALDKLMEARMLANASIALERHVDFDGNLRYERLKDALGPDEKWEVR